MKEAVIDKTITVTIRDVDIPVVQPGQVLIKVVVSGTNPKDWKVPTWRPDAPATNQGDDVAGYVEAVGEGVPNFHKGDRVAAFHQMLTPGGSWAEYAIAWAHTTFHLPEETSFEEAATIPLAATTSAVGLFQQLGLPLPWSPATESLPLIVNGGSSAVGAFAIKLARLSNVHPIIAVAGRGASYVETLIDRSKSDTIIDYRDGDDAVRENIKTVAGGRLVHYAFDAVSEKRSYQNLGAVLTAPAKITVVLPGCESNGLPDGIQLSTTSCGSVHQSVVAGNLVGNVEFGAAIFALFGRGLAQGWFAGHPHEVRPHGLAGIEGAVKDLRAGKASAVKYVVRIADTPEM
ncbi:putative quinone oxidoreductase [Aspergillus violaceofuscus CBS 115571]|uniref:Putative quinone oxidoreductase n=1 Tax=Aspergillus violaceofuscus (strain CBS 115571) TaxID=1450538 RepID=A0A2V5IP78_ASPV1|nr:putative quinone oxidoreductase [Aspergillus violaceofuscus CBS 115571]